MDQFIQMDGKYTFLNNYTKYVWLFFKFLLKKNKEQNQSEPVC